MSVKGALIAALLASIWAAGHLRPALAQDAFYRGKTVTIVVGYSAGGGYDQYARLVARHLGRHIPGKPNVIVQNMPGAASMTSVRYLDANAAEGRHRHHHLRSRSDPRDHCGPRDVQGQVLRLPVGRHAAARHPHLLRLDRQRHQDLGAR